MNPFFKGLASSTSIGAGYLPIAFGFGLAALQAGVSPTSTLLVSVLVFAGASQFVLITLLTSGAGLVSTVGTVALMNARHLFYGPALMPQLSSCHRHLPTPLMAFGLTDEVFAAASSQLSQLKPEERNHWYLGLQVGAYSAWIGGTLLGVLSSTHITTMPVYIEAAMDFILPALFFALLLEIGMTAWRGTMVLAATTTLLLMLVLPDYHALVLGMLAGASLSAWEKAHALDA